jgi:glyoxylase-like metal-dependent hydrolase (beta-lactamase superfamily II)
MHEAALPDGVSVFERGWLSSNNIFFAGKDSSVLVDSGYCTHSDQTLALVEGSLGGRPLDSLLNTHLHSDHCGGNAALQQRYPQLQTLIPPGQAELVAKWDPERLTYLPTGQLCPRFGYDGLLRPGAEIRLADSDWQIHAAPGHDPHSIILFEPSSRTLISADALWERGFGVIFPELEGKAAFAEVAATFELIETLAPLTVIPGHGSVFPYREDVMQQARERLAAFEKNPERHAHHAAKVLLKFKLLEKQQLLCTEFSAWAGEITYFRLVHSRFFADVPLAGWVQLLTEELVSAGVAEVDGRWVRNA